MDKYQSLTPHQKYIFIILTKTFLKKDRVQRNE